MKKIFLRSLISLGVILSIGICLPAVSNACIADPPDINFDLQDKFDKKQKKEDPQKKGDDYFKNFTNDGFDRGDSAGKFRPPFGSPFENGNFFNSDLFSSMSFILICLGDDFDIESFLAALQGTNQNIYLITSEGNGINIQSIEGTPVPLPGAVLLLGSGLMGILGLRKFSCQK